MIRTIKAGRDPKQKTEDASKIRQTVEGILASVESRGDAAVLELSRESDAWSPEQFRLSEREIEQCRSAVRPRELEDMSSVACYVPGGRYPLVASAHMGVVTAKVAGVKRVVALTPPFRGKPAPAVIAAMHLGGADEIYVLGDIQAIAAAASGTESIAPVDFLD